MLRFLGMNSENVDDYEEVSLVNYDKLQNIGIGSQKDDSIKTLEEVAFSLLHFFRNNMCGILYYHNISIWYWSED